jgi:hypothetical protein
LGLLYRVFKDIRENHWFIKSRREGELGFFQFQVRLLDMKIFLDTARIYTKMQMGKLQRDCSEIALGKPIDTFQ